MVMEEETTIFFLTYILDDIDFLTVPVIKNKVSYKEVVVM